MARRLGKLLIVAQVRAFLVPDRRHVLLIVQFTPAAHFGFVAIKLVLQVLDHVFLLGYRALFRADISIEGVIFHLQLYILVKVDRLADLLRRIKCSMVIQTILVIGRGSSIIVCFPIVEVHHEDWLLVGAAVDDHWVEIYFRSKREVS